MEKRADPRSRIGGKVAGTGQIAGLYDLEETLGEGHYAVVKLARHVFTGEKVAVKVIDKMKLDSSTRLQMLQEVQLMKLVQHPHVVRLYEAIDTASKLYLVLEYADGGDMYDYIMRHEGGLDEGIARKYFKQIVTAIQYCHRLHVVHRDLKPENVVFFEKLGIVKLTDFGFSNMFNPGQTLSTSCGSLAYSAPEILLGDAYDAPAVDIWSLGVILYMLVCGSAPFQEANDSETLTMIMDCKYTFPKHISQACKRLISRMLQRQPNARATLQDIVNDPWLGGGADAEGNAIAAEDQLPLVSREHLKEEEHAHILKKMVQGNIATMEEIIEALDLNEYNHITATYFLLAERKLRAQRADMARHMVMRSTERQLHMASSVPTAAGLEASQQAERESEEPTKSSLSVGRSRPSATVDSLLSPETDLKGGCGRSGGGGGFQRFTNIAIVEEEEEDDDADLTTEMSEQVLALDPPRPLSRHSSSTSLVEKTSSQSPTTSAIGLASLVSSAGGDQQHQVPPAPFPISSQIGTGGLSRQGSLRRSEGGQSSATSPIPSSPSTPPGSNVSSNQGSPARYKNYLPNKKLVATRSSPQLVLNQIHEEVEEAGSSPKPALEDPVEAFPSSAAGAAVLRRLEMRRRMHKVRTQSCSSSDCSDDDSESRKKHAAKAKTPPCTKKDSQHDDSSDSQDPSGVGASRMNFAGGGGAGGGAEGATTSGAAGGSSTNTTTSGGNGNGSSNTTKRMHHVSRRHRSLQHAAGSRIRQSHSLNRISELHVVADFSSDQNDDVSNNNSSCPSSVASVVNGTLPSKQFTPQLSSESDTEAAQFDMLTRYLDSLSNRGSLTGGSGLGPTRSRDDSQNSSDGEMEACELRTGRPNATSRRHHKVNLRVLEQRLNKIQEECNKSDADEDEEEEEEEEEEGDVGDEDEEDLSDDPSTLPDDQDNDFIQENNTRNRLHYDKRHSFHNFSLHRVRGAGDDATSTKSCDILSIAAQQLRTQHSNNLKSFGRKPLHRAHSCGSLMSLKERAILAKKLQHLQQPAAVLFGDFESASSKTKDLTLKLAAAASPLTLLHLQNTSRCCNLC